MYFTDDSLFPENMQPLIITAAPYGPEWLPGDADVPLSWDEQVQRAVDCYNAGATVLHVHVRDPKTGEGSSNFEEYNYLIGRLRQAVPKMILPVGRAGLLTCASAIVIPHQRNDRRQAKRCPETDRRPAARPHDDGPRRRANNRPDLDRHRTAP